MILNLDKLTYAGNPENLKDFKGHPRYRIVQGDICDEGVVEQVVRGMDAVINFAAETHVDRSILEPGGFLKTDVFGTYTLLEVVKAYQVPKFIQISTDEVYGSIKTGAFTEESPLSPSSPYAASKAAADLLAHSYWVTYQTPVIITRSSNNLGPYQYPEKLIPLFITNAIEDVNLPLYGDGLNVRDWIYVADNCEAIDLVLHRGELGEIYNIGGGNEKTNIEITEKILAALGKPKSLIQPVKDRPGHDRRYAIDSAKIRGLGFTPRHDFDHALGLTVKWYQEHPEWWKKIKSGEFREYYRKAYENR
jgi:dTDP-glucose 4,6-dehydratase